MNRYWLFGRSRRLKSENAVLREQVEGLQAELQNSLAGHFAFSSELFNRAKVLGVSCDGEFQNINCELTDISLGGVCWSRVNSKILNSQGRAGIEIRVFDGYMNPFQNMPFNGSDEYGHFLLLHPDGYSEHCNPGYENLRILFELAVFFLSMLYRGVFDTAEDIDVSEWSTTIHTLVSQSAEVLRLSAASRGL